MQNPVALVKDSYGSEQLVLIRRRRNHRLAFAFYAPGWRQLNFRTIESAAAKLATHPAFVKWVA